MELVGIKSKMKNIILILILCLSQLKSQSQVFNDTIISNDADTIICKIGLVNNYNIFYQFNPKKKKIVSTHIDRAKVRYFSTPEKNVTVLKQETYKEEIKVPEPKFTESNGIIYPSNVSKPPQFQMGANDLHRYLEIKIRVAPSDKRVFGDNYVVVLYRLTIDSVGAVSDVEIRESSSTTGGYSYDSRRLESEIKKVLTKMPNWTPAIVNSKNSKLSVYLPLKFRLEQNSVIMSSSKSTFLIKNPK